MYGIKWGATTWGNYVWGGLEIPNTNGEILYKKNDFTIQYYTLSPLQHNQLDTTLTTVVPFSAGVPFLNLRMRLSAVSSSIT